MNKVTNIIDAISIIKDGQTIMVGGFGVPGTPFMLIEALLQQGTRHLTLIKNEANEPHLGVSKLIEAGRVDRLITSHLGLNTTVLELMHDKKIAVEFNPQGILVERIRCGGAGLIGFISDIGIDTVLSQNKQAITLNGQKGVVESALRADVAMIHAAVGDDLGNLVYEKSARNFNPAMATAADIVIAEVESIVNTGSLDPDTIHTPSAFVDRVVEIGKLQDEYGILEHHVFA
ncbi:MAG: CoA transferase subunit A [Deltaproteobacteria bacterium]|nr:CoA transferase subunit A [Deltaproteobacteria bacterium]